MTITGHKHCVIEGCHRNAHWSARGVRGHCCAHHKRLLRHGDPLAGGTFYGDPERFFRETVLSFAGSECLKWPFGHNGEGYGLLNVDGRDCLVSRLVCEEVFGPPPSPDHTAAHSCGKGHEACCSQHHLSWKSQADNLADRIGHGTSPRGENQGASKLTESDVYEIRGLRGVVVQREIASRFGVSFQTVNNIFMKKTWGWLGDKPPMNDQDQGRNI